MRTKYQPVKSVTRQSRQGTHRLCGDCGAAMEGKLQAYHYTECGLSKVKLEKVLVFECACGTRIPEIPAIAELHFLIMIDILLKRSLLSGEEIRFLRKMAGLTQSEIAEIIGVDKTRPSKWESSSSGEEIGKENDRVLRSCCLFGMIQQVMKTSAEEAVSVTKAHRDLIQKLDVKEIFRAIKDSSNGPKQITIESNPDSGSSERWLIPGGKQNAEGSRLH